MRARWVGLVLALALVPVRAAAEAGPSDEVVADGKADTAEGKDAAARANFRLGERLERDRKYEAAVARYRKVLALDPGNWFAAAARSRIEVLSQYAGAFDDLAALDAVRKDPTKVDDRGAIEALERAAQGFAGRARAEALLFVAEAWVGRLQAPLRGADAALTVARDPRADRVQRDAAWDLAWAALKSDLPRAVREIAGHPDAPAAIRARVLRDARRARLHVASVVVSASAAIAGAGALLLAIRRGRARVTLALFTHPLAIVFLVVTPLVAALVADAWERGFGAHFAPLSAVLVAMHAFAAAWRGAFGDLDTKPGRAVRLLGGALAAVAMFGAAYLVLERSEAQGTPLLASFGL